MYLSQRQLFLQHNTQTSTAPLLIEIAFANGNYLTDIEGKKYLDLISGISVSSLGHGRKEVVDAIQKQAETHMHLMVYGDLIQTPQVQLAAELAASLPASLSSVYLVNSGTEAVEGAMKLAKRFTGKHRFAAHTSAYHGSSQGALSLMDSSYFTDAFRPLLPGVVFLEQNNIESLQQLDDNVAAIVIELVQAEKGAIPCTKEWVQACREYCNRNGALLIFDEIQTGMGRCGSLFAFEQYHVVPDVLLLGKAFGAGMPLAAFVSSGEIMGCLSHHPVLGHITTFGGHPVSCAAALAGLKVLVSELDGYQIAEKSQRFADGLRHPKAGPVTGLGLLLALHLSSEQDCMNLIQHCLQNGVFSDWFLHAPDCLRIAPPLGITFEEIDMACEVIRAGLDKI